MATDVEVASLRGTQAAGYTGDTRARRPGTRATLTRSQWTSYSTALSQPRLAAAERVPRSGTLGATRASTSAPRLEGAGSRFCARAQGHISGSGAWAPVMRAPSGEAAASVESPEVGEQAEEEEVMATDLGRGRRFIWPRRRPG